LDLNIQSFLDIVFIGVSHKLPEHIVQDASILEVIDLRLGVKTAGNGESLTRISCDSNVLTNSKISFIQVDSELFPSVESKRVGRLSSLELHREDTHTN
jgi:hypothetical protein